MDIEKNNQRQVQPVPPPEYYPPAYYYEDEIDLHDYVDVLVRYKWLVIAVPLVALLVAGVLGFVVMEPTYEATALVAITRPRYIVQFASNFETVPLDQRQVPLKAYPTIATSHDLLQQLLPLVADRLPAEARSLRQLRDMVSARNGQDPSLIELTVTASDPDLAAYVANVWAAQFADKIQTVYGQAATEIEAFEEQLKDANQRRQIAEQAVVEFQARNPAAILEAQITDQKEALTSFFQTKRTLERVIQDAESLRDRLAMQRRDAPSSFSDELTALLLDVNSLSSSMSSATAAPLQLQIQASGSVAGKTAGEQITFLDNLVTVLEAKDAELDEKIAAVEPQLLNLQKELEAALTEQKQLEEERQIARDLCRSLTLKLEEARLSEETNGREVQVAAQAVPPLTPSSPRKVMMLGVAGTLGLMVGVFGAFVVNFFANGRKKR
ncbi:MAG: GumC family protein [Anaerolineae bacterium]